MRIPDRGAVCPILRAVAAALALAAWPALVSAIALDCPVKVERCIDGTDCTQPANWFLVAPAPGAMMFYGDQFRITATLVNNTGLLGRLCADVPPLPTDPVPYPEPSASGGPCRDTGTGSSDAMIRQDAAIPLLTGEYWLWPIKPDDTCPTELCPQAIAPQKPTSPVSLISADTAYFYYNGNFMKTNQEYDPGTDTWTDLAPMTQARGRLGAAAPGNGKIYAIGGWGQIGGLGGTTYLATVEEYSPPPTNSWAPRQSMTTPRAWLGVAALNGKIYAIGGQNWAGPSAVVEEYDPGTNTWTTKDPMPSGPRYGLAVVAVPSLGKIYAIGGYDASGAVTGLIEEFDPLGTPQWTAAAKAPLNTARAEMGAAMGNDGVTPNDVIYVFGGYPGGGAPGAACDTEEFDPVGNSCAAKGGFLSTTGKYRLAGEWVPGFGVYAIGGEGDGSWWGCPVNVFPPPAYNTNVEVYDPVSDFWTQKAAMISVPPAKGRSMHAVANEGGKLYVVGGFTGYQFGPSVLGEDNRSTVTWTFKAAVAILKLDFYLYASDYGDIDAFSPPLQEGWWTGLPVFFPSGSVSGDEGAVIDCSMPGCPWTLYQTDTLTGSLLTGYCWGGFITSTCPFLAESFYKVLDNGGDRPAGKAYFDDTVQVFTSVTNNGKADWISPGDVCNKPTIPCGDMTATVIQETAGCSYTPSSPWTGPRSPVPPVMSNIFDKDMFEWTYSIEGNARSIRDESNWCKCWETGVGCKACGTVYWESMIKCNTVKSPELIVEAPPISITSTTWVEPDKNPAGGLPAQPLGPFDAVYAGPIYYMANEWVEGRFIFTNNGTHAVDIIPQAYMAGVGPADVQVVAGFPKVGGVPLVSSVTLAPGASVTVTWAYEPAPGGSFMNGCMTGDIGAAIVAGARGVCHFAAFMYRAHPFIPYDVGAEPPPKAIKMAGPSSGYQGVPFDVTVSLANSAPREVQIAAPLCVTLYVDYSPALPCLAGAPSSTFFMSGPNPPLPWNFSRNGAAGDKKTFTFTLESDCKADMFNQVGLNWDTPPALLPAGNPCFSGCIQSPGSCDNGPRKTQITAPAAVYITSLTASPPSACDFPDSLIKVEMVIRNDDPDGNSLTVTKFCDGQILGTSPAGTNLATGWPAPTLSPWPALGAIAIPSGTSGTVTWYFLPRCSYPQSTSFGCFTAGVEQHPYVQGYMTPSGAPASADFSGIWPQVTVFRHSSFSCSIWVDKEETSVGLPIKVYFNVMNTGGNDAADFTVDVVANGTSGGSASYASGPLPVPPTTFNGTSSPIHCATPSIGQSGTYVFTFSALSKGKVSFTGSAKWRDSQCDTTPKRVESIATPKPVNIASAAQLTCSANATPLVTMAMPCATCAPESSCNPATGEGCVTVQMLASNFGDITLVGATPSPSFGNVTQPCDTVNVCRSIKATGQGSVAIHDAPQESKAPVELSPRGSRTFTWIYLPKAPGCVQLRTSISGWDIASGNTLYCDAYTNCVEILARWPMELRLMPGVGEVAPGQEFTITVEVCNPGATKASMQGGEPTLQFFMVSTGANVTEQFEVIPPVPTEIQANDCLKVPVKVKVGKSATVGQVQVRLSQGDLFIARDTETGLAIRAENRGTPMNIIVTDGKSTLKIRENPVHISKHPAVISYCVGDAGRVAKSTKLKVYTVTGELVRTLVDKTAVIETVDVPWDGRNDSGQLCASGIYLVRLEGPNFSKVKKLALVK